MSRFAKCLLISAWESENSENLSLFEYELSEENISEYFSKFGLRIKSFGQFHSDISVELENDAVQVTLANDEAYEDIEKAREYFNGDKFYFSRISSNSEVAADELVSLFLEAFDAIEVDEIVKR